MSGYIWAEGIKGGRGANFSIEDVYTFSEQIYDTEGGWEYIEYYGKTGPDQDMLTVFARVGGYGGESKGKARFDDIRITGVTGDPDIGVIAKWYTPADPEKEDPGDSNSRLFLILTGAGWLAVFLLFAAYFNARKRSRLSAADREKF